MGWKDEGHASGSLIEAKHIRKIIPVTVTYDDGRRKKKRKK